MKENEIETPPTTPRPKGKANPYIIYTLCLLIIFLFSMGSLWYTAEGFKQRCNANCMSYITENCPITNKPFVNFTDEYIPIEPQ